MNHLIQWLISLFRKSAKPSKPSAPPADPPTAPSDPSPAPDEFTTARFHTCPKEAGQFKVVSSLAVEIRGSRLYFTTDHPELWPNVDGCIGELHCMLYRDGQWHAGPIDGMRPFAQNGGDRSTKCAAVPDNDNRLYEARSGDKVGFVVSDKCRNMRSVKLPGKRTGIAWITWP